MRICISILLGAALAATSGCGGVDCAEGTFASGNDCVGFDPNDRTPPVVTLSPAGVRSRDPLPPVAQLTTDEPAVVFFTLDGSEPTTDSPGEPSPASVLGITQGLTVTYFAVDRAGNQSEIQTGVFDSDQVAPARPRNLSLTVSGADVTLTWENPPDADYEGTLIARVSELVDTLPTPGVKYTPGEALSTSLVALQATSGTTFTDPAVSFGRVRYVAWAFDDLGNYSEPIAVRGKVAVGSLDTTLEFAANTLTQTVTTTEYDLAFTQTVVGGELRIDLTLTNKTRQHFLNPKIEITGVTGGQVTGATGTADGLSFFDLGQGALPPNTARTRQIRFNNLAATTTIGLRLAEHQVLTVTDGQSRSQRFIDVATGTTQTTLFTSPLPGPNGQFGRIRPSIAVGERFIDIPTSHGTIERWDMVTNTQNGGATVAAEARVNVMCMVADSAREFAVVKLNSNRQLGKLRVLRFDENLVATGSIDLPTNEDRGFSRSALSPDGSVLAVPGIEGIALIDTDTMTLIDADESLPGVDLITSPLNDRIRVVTWIDADTLVVMARQEGRAAVLQRTAGVFVVLQDHQDISSRGHGIAVGPDQRVWLAFDAGLRIYDPTTNNVTNSTYPNLPAAIRFINGELYVLRNNRSTIDVVDGNGAVLAGRTFSFPGFSAGHYLEVTTR